MTHLTEKECNLVCALIMCASGRLNGDMERFTGNDNQITQQQLNDLLERLEMGTDFLSHILNEFKDDALNDPIRSNDYQRIQLRRED